MNTFKCENCDGVFKKIRPEHEAIKEFEESPWNIPGDEISLVCDVCFEKFTIWFNSLTPQDHKRMRDQND